MGVLCAVWSLGVADFNIDDYPGVVAWASCPQKGVLSLPLTYAPVSFTDKAIEMVKKRGCRTYVHHPILDARHWGIIDGKDVETPAYHQTHSCYAVDAFPPAPPPPSPPTGAVAKHRITPITRRRCARRSKAWAATSPRT